MSFVRFCFYYFWSMKISAYFLHRSISFLYTIMKVKANESARTKFFLASPEIARLAAEAKKISGVHTNPINHHKLSPTYIANKEKAVAALTSILKNCTNPFSENRNNLFNIATEVVAPLKSSNTFAIKITSGGNYLRTLWWNESSLATLICGLPWRRENWKQYEYGEKSKDSDWTCTCSCRVERGSSLLFARLLVVCQSRPEINLEEVISKYEFSVVPRALFAADGIMLHCSAKSNLLGILISTEAAPILHVNPILPEKAVAVVDALAEIQAIGKPQGIKTCAHLAEHFTERLVKNVCHFAEFIWSSIDMMCHCP